MNSYLTKSYGTVLRDHPEVEEMALTCYTFKLTPGETVDISKIPKKQKVVNIQDKFKEDEWSVKQIDTQIDEWQSTMFMSKRLACVKKSKNVKEIFNDFHK